MLFTLPDMNITEMMMNNRIMVFIVLPRLRSFFKIVKNILLLLILVLSHSHNNYPCNNYYRGSGNPHYRLILYLAAYDP